MKKVGIVGWRGMVGSVLMQRMSEEADFAGIETTFFTSSQVGDRAPLVTGAHQEILIDASDLTKLQQMDIILTCQGGDYTSVVYPQLRRLGWKGYWIDAASTLRMNDDALIVLDPINGDIIRQGLSKGVRTYVGGNCTVSLMLMGIGGLYQAGLVEWMSAMTYQAASGAGAKNMRELINQMGYIHQSVAADLQDPAQSILDIDRRVSQALRSESYPKAEFGAPLAGSLIPWIDAQLDSGQSKEEWKGSSETNKILGLAPNTIPIDGTCVRIGAMRSHSQGLTVKLKQAVPLDEVNEMIQNHNQWVHLVNNDRSSSAQQLTPAAVSGTLTVAVGRVRKMLMGDDFLNVFTVGDQLLWGAAEPLRRMLRIIVDE